MTLPHPPRRGHASRASKSSLPGALTILFCCLAACSPNHDEQDRRPPHVLIVMADDLGWKDVGFHGCKDIPTPNLDLLAAQGVVFQDAHVSASVCAPSRTGFMLGRYQQREGCEGNGRKGHGLPIQEPRTFPAAMQEAGYETLCLGKWHLGLESGRHPLDQGYEHFRGFLAGSRSYWSEPKIREQQALERNRKRVPEEEIDYLTDWITDEACDLITRRDPKRPMMMVVNYNAPHTPMHARREDLARFDHIEDKRRRTYAAMVSRMDHGIGRILETLETAGMTNDTLVVFFSDNGGATNNGSDNGPWRGMKGSKWEGGHRVPFVMRWPARLRPQRHPHLVSTLDLMPTCLSAGGNATPAWADGMNLLPWLGPQPGTPPVRALYWRRMVASAVREGRWKLVRIQKEDGKGYDRHLIDLQGNAAETKDLLTVQPEVARRLTQRLEQWESGMRTPLWREGKRWERNQRFKHRMDTLGRAMERKFP